MSYAIAFDCIFKKQGKQFSGVSDFGMVAPHDHLFSFQWEALISPHKQNIQQDNIQQDKEDAWDLACNLRAYTSLAFF